MGLYAQPPEAPLTVDWIYGPQARLVSAVPNYFWTSNGPAIIYDRRKPQDERTFYKLDPATGKQEKILDSRKALESLKANLPADSLPDYVAWPDEFDRSGDKALYLFAGDVFVLDLSKSQFSRVTKTPQKEKDAHFSPDGNRVAFVRDNDLYVYDLAEKSEKRLTDDGSDTILNGTLSWVYWEEIFGRHDIGYWWSEDSRSIAFLRTDDSLVSLMYYSDFKPYTPRIITQRYPKAGQANPVVKVGIADVDSGEKTWVDFSKFPYEYIVRVNWLPDDKHLCVQTLNRTQTRLDLLLVDRNSGKPAHLLTETDSAWVNIHDDLHFLPARRQFIWASERDGYAHLYLYNMDGSLQNHITSGDWSIRSAGPGVAWVQQALVGVDEKNGWVYFTAQKKSPIERQLYRVRLDGSGMEQLTQTPGFHNVTFSPDAKYYFDRFSNASTPPSLSLCESSGNQFVELAKPETKEISGFDLQYQQFFHIPASDGFEMPASIIKPRDFDANKKYPIILNVYGGPSAPTVNNVWKSSIFFDNILVNNGYLVVRVDNRSATAISKKLENLALKNLMSDGELNDLVDAVRWLNKQTYVDPQRVGVWGWSGGGTFTLLAMTRSQEFKAGIAVAPVTDFRFYDTRWTEYSMKRPQDDLQGYEKSSLLQYAKDLHGRLLLVHGTYDDNVNIQNSWAFVDQLIRANKMFDMMIYPMRKHGISDRPARIHLYTRMLEFWKKNL